jgi:hypothetical protein
MCFMGTYVSMAKIYQVDNFGTKSKETPVETFCKSSRYADLKRIIRDILNKFRLQRLPKSVWLYLRRNGRLHTHQKQSADEQRNETLQSNPTQTENTEYGVPQLYICDMVRCYSLTVFQEVNNRIASVASEIHTVSVSAGSKYYHHQQLCFYDLENVS